MLRTLTLVCLLLAVGCDKEGDAPTQPATSSEEAPVAAQGRIVCNGSQSLEFSGLTLDLAGQSAIVASDECRLRISDATVSGAVGIDATGSAEIEFIGGSLTGSEAAVRARDKAVVTLRGVKIDGARDSTGSSRIRERRAR